VSWPLSFLQKTCDTWKCGQKELSMTVVSVNLSAPL